MAARSTASFPGAFEPHFVRVDDEDGLANLPNLKGIADFTASGFVVDGGVLDNSPIDYALDRIFKQRATGPVRRALAFVVPDPGGAKTAPKPLERDETHGMMRANIDSDKIDELSATLFKTFLAQRKQDAIRMILAEIEKGFAAIDKGGGHRDVAIG